MRLLSAILLFLVGCDGNPPKPPAGSINLALGHRADDGSFDLYREGQDVTLVAGAQGGFHVWLSYQMSPAPSSGEGTLERSAHRGNDDALILRTMGEVELDGAVSSPLPMFMCPAPVGLSVLEQPIQYQLRFTDSNKQEIAHGQVTLVPHCPAEQLEFCQRICSG